MPLTRKADAPICGCHLLVYGPSSRQLLKEALRFLKGKTNSEDFSAVAVDTFEGPAVRFEWSSYYTERSLLESLSRGQFDPWIDKLSEMFKSTRVCFRIGSRMVTWQ